MKGLSNTLIAIKLWKWRVQRTITIQKEHLQRRTIFLYLNLVKSFYYNTDISELEYESIAAFFKYIYCNSNIYNVIKVLLAVQSEITTKIAILVCKNYQLKNISNGSLIGQQSRYTVRRIQAYRCLCMSVCGLFLSYETSSVKVTFNNSVCYTYWFNKKYVKHTGYLCDS